MSAPVHRAGERLEPRAARNRKRARLHLRRQGARPAPLPLPPAPRRRAETVFALRHRERDEVSCAVAAGAADAAPPEAGARLHRGRPPPLPFGRSAPLGFPRIPFSRRSRKVGACGAFYGDAAGTLRLLSAWAPEASPRAAARPKRRRSGDRLRFADQPLCLQPRRRRSQPHRPRPLAAFSSRRLDSRFADCRMGTASALSSRAMSCSSSELSTSRHLRDRQLGALSRPYD